MGVTGSIITGVISGILTSLLVYFGVVVIRRIVIPWYQKVRYDGVDLNDSWRCENSRDDGESIFRLELRQEAYILSGQLIYTRFRSGDESIISYAVKGSIWEGYVMLNMKSKDRKRIAFATALLKIDGGGDGLTGFISYRHFRDGKVDTTSVSFNRVVNSKMKEVK